MKYQIIIQQIGGIVLVLVLVGLFLAGIFFLHLFSPYIFDVTAKKHLCYQLLITEEALQLVPVTHPS